MPANNRPRRVQLAVPASNVAMMAKAASSQADHVFLDLEDAVAPASKDIARAKAVKAINGLDWGDKLVCVRINDLRTPYAYRDVIDIVEAAGERLDTLLLPKALAASDVLFLDTLLDQIEKRQNLGRRIGIEVLIEEASGLAQVEAIAAASNRIEALVFGMGDYSASQRMPADWVTGGGTYPGDVWHFARFKIAMAASANGLQAIDGPFSNYSDRDGYIEEARRARSLGFSGKWAIHPSQIAPALDTFTPSATELCEARRLLTAYEVGIRNGKGAVAVDGTMVDIGSARILLALINRAEACSSTGRPEQQGG